MELDFSTHRQVLIDPSQKIPSRMRSLFTLRSIGTFECVKALEEAFYSEPSSDLMRHEICYCMGQILHTEEQKKEVQKFCEDILSSNKYAPIVIHEAVEALGNVSEENTRILIKKFENAKESIVKVYETCYLALTLLDWNKETNNGETEGLDLKKLNHITNDPAPPFNYEKDKKWADIELLKKILLDKESDLFLRYRAMFTLRELDTEDSVLALCKVFEDEHSPSCSPLLKHEVAFVLGQMNEHNKISEPYLKFAIENPKEDSIVKHEAALTFGDITKDKAILSKYLNDTDQLLRESCEVAIDTIDYWDEK